MLFIYLKHFNNIKNTYAEFHLFIIILYFKIGYSTKK